MTKDAQARQREFHRLRDSWALDGHTRSMLLRTRRAAALHAADTESARVLYGSGQRALRRRAQTRKQTRGWR